MRFGPLQYAPLFIVKRLNETKRPVFELGLLESVKQASMTRKRNRIRFGCLAQFHAHKSEVDRLLREGHRGAPIYEHLGLDMSYAQFMRYVREFCDRDTLDPPAPVLPKPGNLAGTAAAKEPAKPEKKMGRFEHNAKPKSVAEFFNGE